MRDTKKKGRSQRKSRRVIQNRLSIIAISCVLVMLTGVLMVSSVSLCKRNDKYKVQEAKLEAQIREEDKREHEIEYLEEYIHTDEYVEDVAKDKLGLAYPDELYFEAE